MSSGVLGSLRALRDRLDKIAPYPWDAVQAWAAAARPLFRAELGDHLSDFETAVKDPRWADPPFFATEDLYGNRTDNFAEARASAEQSDRQLATRRKAQILAFVDGLIDVLERKSPSPASGHHLQQVRALIDGFERVCRALSRRPHGRDALLMTDEYDVQYLFGALLKGLFDDVRAEEPTPSYGGGGARMDFIIKSERLVIELKMTRDGLNDRTVTDQLLVDIGRYPAHPDCATLVCFVYDPGFKLKNPRAIENDLTKQHGDLDVHVLVRPV